MKFLKALGLVSALFMILFVFHTADINIACCEQKYNDQQVFCLSNNRVKYSVFYYEGKIISDSLATQPQWLTKFRTKSFSIETNADFGFNIMWNGWRAPGKTNNAENPILFSKQNFHLIHHDINELPEGTEELNLFFKGTDNPFEVKITYQLEPNAFYIRRKVSIRDTKTNNHFLRLILPLQGYILGDISIIKSGGFGQPTALLSKEGGAFFGLEYPTAENILTTAEKGKTRIHCGQEIGELIGNDWIESEWVVEGLSPNSYVKLWFWKYLDHIRVAPLKPYLLYNTWYDVRAPEIVKKPSNIMNEKNLLRIIDTFRKEMVEKHGLKLDAFVLDDGWDIYKSDWELRNKQFPSGLSPIAAELKKMGTDLGIWFGPIGGYSNREWRVNWMKDHGYELVKDQMCIAGKNYHQLFKKRVINFVRNDGVGYYKWDGIQFSCSEPNHGHPIGIYSRRAVMESVIDLCKSVRAENPNVFLNITSGTWLSPWWIKYANTIWMQGEDYGYANVPSISRRDAAITYRDYVLFEDLNKYDFWFPIANLMTHGIIKGNLQKLGGEKEPLDKFTDNALLYFARGVSMWELYVSPDLLSNSEWDALAKSIRWAKDRFEILRSTEMIGGDPGKKLSYGYVHFVDNRGIVAARNPFITPQTLKVKLSPALGLNPKVSSLVLERIYPTRWIDTKIYSAGDTIELSLDGYKTAVYEIYPIQEADEPLLAGVIFDSVQTKNSDYKMKFYHVTNEAKILNPKIIKSMTLAGKKADINNLSIPSGQLTYPVNDIYLKSTTKAEHAEIDLIFNLHEATPIATLAILLEPDANSTGKELPKVTINKNGKFVEIKSEKQIKRWSWHMIDVQTGKQSVKIKMEKTKLKEQWNGKVSLWLVYRQKMKGTDVSFKLNKNSFQRPMPPQPWPTGEMRKNIKLGENVTIKLQGSN